MTAARTATDAGPPKVAASLRGVVCAGRVVLSDRAGSPPGPHEQSEGAGAAGNARDKRRANIKIGVRGTETLSLSADDLLFEGDRIITLTSGATEVTAYGCTRSLASLDSQIIAADFCSQTIASVAADGTVLADAAIVQGAGIGATLPIAGFAATAAAGDDGASSP